MRPWGAENAPKGASRLGHPAGIAIQLKEGSYFLCGELRSTPFKAKFAESTSRALG
jgi:hypothetical protein